MNPAQPTMTVADAFHLAGVAILYRLQQLKDDRDLAIGREEGARQTEAGAKIAELEQARELLAIAQAVAADPEQNCPTCGRRMKP